AQLFFFAAVVGDRVQVPGHAPLANRAVVDRRAIQGIAHLIRYQPGAVGLERQGHHVEHRAEPAEPGPGVIHPGPPSVWPGPASGLPTRAAARCRESEVLLAPIASSHGSANRGWTRWITPG